MKYDIIFIIGEEFNDHPMCGAAILKHLLESEGYTVGVIDMPKADKDVMKLGKPNLFFGVSSGSIDSMVRNYTALKKLRADDKHLNYNESVPDRATIVYSNWIKKHFPNSIIVLGGTEASLRRFTHYDYWSNKLRKPLLFDAKVEILIYGNAEKQILEVAKRIKDEQSLMGIDGTCIITKDLPKNFIELPSYSEVSESKDKFCDMQNMIDNKHNFSQKVDNRYALQYKSPKYTSKDLDKYYSFPFKREVKGKHLRGFEFSVVTHRGCIGNCNFCSLRLLQGDRIISRSEGSILKEIEYITTLPHFKGNIDDLGGPSANMYGMDCNECEGNCIDCIKLDRSNAKLISLLRKARNIKGVKNVFVRSGIRYDLASGDYIKELATHHVSGTLKIAPEHVNKKVLKLMNKDKGDLIRFIKEFSRTGKQLSFYFMTAHPGSSIKEARELSNTVKRLKNAKSVQIFVPTPMTVSTCMYYAGVDPKTRIQVYVPYSFSEKKLQKRIIIDD